MPTEPPAQSKRERRNAAREHAAALRLAERRRQRRRRLVVWSSAGAAAAVVLAAIVVLAVTLSSTASAGSTAASAGTIGPEGMADETGTVLAANTTGTSGATKDGIACNTGEGAAEHIHTHVAVYVDGRLRPIPVGVGVVTPSVQDAGTPDAFAQATRCYYWLHVHASDGVIHVEAPAKATYTLGQFFAVWGQPLSATNVAGATGRQTVFVDGKRFTGDPATIALGSREDIQIDVGRAVPFRAVDWSASQL
ncbi:hypothetical protein [Amnibacterium kyonggiense]|uniref:Uncharacterized protein n=1 Tax=Amnibacterium kyonggiense TaxID=595671 RepID=A0A4R7FH68_9MICO|nr:hypothetical protein [Amnibacterium kyonggiense]TDS76077.1 hypothetical protein CLV52_3193 [Amnibacterium kyonggiense]